MDLQALLSDLSKNVSDELIVNPEVVDKGDTLDVERLLIEARKWYKLTKVVAVFADLKGSTNLGVGKHAASTAAIYQAAIGGLTQIFNNHDADFVAIQGDGAFGLFWGDLSFERAICAGITIKTFSEKTLVPQLNRKWPELPKTGFKVGIAVSKILVKKIGVPRTNIQEPVWAGKAVNYAVKCAQQAEVGEMIVTGSIWDFAETNDYLSVSCPCGTGPSESIWKDTIIAKIHEGDGERSGRILTSSWCDKHGSEYCSSILSGKTKHPEVQAIAHSLKKVERENVLWRKDQILRENKRNLQRGLRLAGH